MWTHMETYTYIHTYTIAWMNAHTAIHTHTHKILDAREEHSIHKVLPFCDNIAKCFKDLLSKNK